MPDGKHPAMVFDPADPREVVAVLELSPQTLSTAGTLYLMITLVTLCLMIT